MASKTVKKRKCNSCGKTVPVSEGKKMLRGLTFYCNACYKKKKKKNKATGEVCEFC